MILRILDVEEYYSGAVLSADATAADTVLHLSSVSDFGDAGTLQIGSEIKTYVTDPVALTLIISSGLANGYSQQTFVFVSPKIITRRAILNPPDRPNMVYDDSVAVEGLGSVAATVPHALWDKLPLGLRASNEGELASLAFQGGRLVIVDIVGRTPSVDGSFITPNTVLAVSLSVAQLSDIATDMGSLTAGTVTGATIQTGVSGARIVMTSTGLVVYDNSNFQTLTIDNSGSIYVQGVVAFGTSSLQADGTIKFLGIKSSGNLTPSRGVSGCVASSDMLATTGSKTVALPQPTSIGNTLLMSVYARDASGGTAPTFTTPLGWTIVGSSQTLSGQRMTVYKKENAAPLSSQSLTITNGSGSFGYAIELLEYINAGIVDATVGATGTSASPTATTGATVQIEEISVAFVAWYNNVGVGEESSPSAGYSASQRINGMWGFGEFGPTAVARLVSYDKALSATGAQTFAATIISSDWIEQIVTIKGAAASAVPPTPSSGSGVLYAVQDSNSDVRPMFKDDDGVAWDLRATCIGIQHILNGTTSYTLSAGASRIFAEAVGSGGAGGGTAITGAGTVGAGGGGGSGGYSEVFLTALLSGALVVAVGAGGTGVSGANGNGGNITTLKDSGGTIRLEAVGGAGGSVGTPTPPAVGGAGGGGGTILSAIGDLKIGGTAGSPGISLAANATGFVGGQGGSSEIGAGGAAKTATGQGTAGNAHGGGGGGAGAAPSQSAQIGGVGGNGLLRITEYA